MSPLETCAVCGLALIGSTKHVLRLELDGRNRLHLALCREHAEQGCAAAETALRSAQRVLAFKPPRAV